MSRAMHTASLMCSCVPFLIVDDVGSGPGGPSSATNVQPKQSALAAGAMGDKSKGKTGEKIETVVLVWQCHDAAL